jgi:hypothetical protein
MPFAIEVDGRRSEAVGAASRSCLSGHRQKFFDKSTRKIRTLPKMDVQIAREEIAVDESPGVRGRFGSGAAHSPRPIIGGDRFVADPIAVPKFMRAEFHTAIGQ